MNGLYIILLIVNFLYVDGQILQKPDTVVIAFGDGFELDQVDVFINGIFIGEKLLHTSLLGSAGEIGCPVISAKRFEVTIVFYERKGFVNEYNPMWTDTIPNKFGNDYVKGKVFTQKFKYKNGKYIDVKISSGKRIMDDLEGNSDLNLEFKQRNKTVILD